MSKRSAIVCFAAFTCVLRIAADAEGQIGIAGNVPAGGTAGAAQATDDVEIGRTISVKVIDEDGNPVKDCSVTPYSLGSADKRGLRTSTLWSPESHGRYVNAVTDDQGVAKIDVPKWMHRKLGLLTSSLTLLSDHPDFCISHSFVGAIGGIDVTTVALKRGGFIRLHALMPNGRNPLSDFRVQMSGYFDGARDWPAITSGPPGRISRGLMPGRHLVRIVQPGKEGTLFFSEVVNVEVKAGVTEDRLLRLKPSVTVSGRLSDDVPRPVRNGYVVASVTDYLSAVAEPQRFRSAELTWVTWRKVDEDGSFVIDQLPPSGQVGLHVWCDGFCSRCPELSTLPEYLQSKLFRSGAILPQFFDLDVADEPVVVQMERSATCEVRLVRIGGAPIQDGKVSLTLRASYGTRSRLYGLAGRFEESVLQRPGSLVERVLGGGFGIPRTGASFTLHRTFSAITNDDGLAVIRDVPAADRIMLNIKHDEFVVEGQKPGVGGSFQRIEAKPGVTGTSVFRMKPKPAVADPAESE